jgi:gamma-glutamylcyclotransferase (GGCT)/AIG2-like uncharacterized protein YtfP
MKKKNVVEITSVFVYGTLKPGLRYYSVAQKGGTFTQAEAYLEGFELYHLEPENYPAIVPGRGRVYGWVYDFEDIAHALVYLDELEGLHVTPPEYERVEVLAYPSRKKVWVYVFLKLQEKTAFKLESGVWLPKESQDGLLPRGLE